MSAFSIRPIHGDYLAIMHGEIRAAVIFPAEAGVKVYPWMPSYPTLTFDGLPAPLEPHWMAFPGLPEVAALLGIEPLREAA